MAIALDQDLGFAGSSTTDMAVSGTFPAGALIVVTCAFGTATASQTISQNGTNSFTQLFMRENSATNNLVYFYGYIQNWGGGALSANFHLSGTGKDAAARILSFTGAATTGGPLLSLDVVGAPSGTAWDTAAVTGTTGANDLIVVGWDFANSTTTTFSSPTGTPTSGWTQTAVSDGSSANTPHGHALMMYTVLSAAATNPDGQITAAATKSWGGSIATFGPALASGAPGKPLPWTLLKRRAGLSGFAATQLAIQQFKSWPLVPLPATSNGSTVNLAAALTASAAVAGTNTESVALSASLAPSVALAAANAEAVALSASLSASAAIAGTNAEASALSAALTASSAVAGTDTKAVALSASLSVSASLTVLNVEAVALNAALTASAVVAGTVTSSGSGALSAAITASATIVGTNVETVALATAISSSSSVAGSQTYTKALLAALSASAALASTNKETGALANAIVVTAIVAATISASGVAGPVGEPTYASAGGLSSASSAGMSEATSSGRDSVTGFSGRDKASSSGRSKAT